MHVGLFVRVVATVLALATSSVFANAATSLQPIGPSGVTPDGRNIRPVGFTYQVGRFPCAMAPSPDGAWLAVLVQGDGAVDIVDPRASRPVLRIGVPSAAGLAWTPDGLYVSGGYSGVVSRFRYDASTSKRAPVFVKRADIHVGPPGLLNGIADDAATHRIAVARTADHQVVIIDDTTDATLATLATSGEPFGVAFVGTALIATQYNSDHVDAWRSTSGDAVRITTGSHPTVILGDGNRAFVGNADGHDVVEIDSGSMSVTRRFDLALSADMPPGQTPSGMALSDDRSMLFVAESGLNDVAIVELARGRVVARIPTGWYPMAVAFAQRSTVSKKDDRPRSQLWVASAKGLGPQSDTGGEDNAAFTGIVQHLTLEPQRYAQWTAQAARNEHPLGPISKQTLPPIKHVVFIVKENKHFDEEFGDEPRANADPALVLYDRAYTPNMHALAERYTLLDNFMGNGEASVWGHSWATQGMANDYNDRNAHGRGDMDKASTRVAWSIWPYAMAGEDTVSASTMDFDWYQNLGELPGGARINSSGVFGPRGQLIDELQRRGKSFRVYGEQMTMLPSGAIAPGLAEHADREYPGTHINFDVLDTTRAKLFIKDLALHGLAQYTYMTLPTDHTAGTRPGTYTPASFVVNNDEALGQIVAAISKRPEWRDTVIFVTTDDPAGTGDHISSQRMPAFAIGPYIKRSYVDSTRYSIPSILRTVELAFGLSPLNIFDAYATPMTAAFSATPSVEPYTPLPPRFAMEKNPGTVGMRGIDIDGPEAAAIPRQEWRSLRGPASLAAHEGYLAAYPPWTRVVAALP